MKVVKWGVHGTGTCIGPGILLLLDLLAVLTAIDVKCCIANALNDVVWSRTVNYLRGVLLSRNFVSLRCQTLTFKSEI